MWSKLYLLEKVCLMLMMWVVLEAKCTILYTKVNSLCNEIHLLLVKKRKCVPCNGRGQKKVELFLAFVARVFCIYFSFVWCFSIWNHWILVPWIRYKHYWRWKNKQVKKHSLQIGKHGWHSTADFQRWWEPSCSILSCKLGDYVAFFWLAGCEWFCLRLVRLY